MTAKQYKAKRKKIGAWKAVAEMLGLNWSTIARREAGTLPITKEAALAMDALAGRAAGAGVGAKRNWTRSKRSRAMALTTRSAARRRAKTYEKHDRLKTRRLVRCIAEFGE